MDLLIFNGTIINEEQTLKGSILISGGKIKQIFPGNYNIPNLANVIDATGKYVVPGAIDTHVHFREPGLTHKATISSESQAALVGGVTTFFDMPNTIPATTTQAFLKEKLKIASKSSAINYGFYLAATKDNLHEITQIPASIYPGIKIFYAPSTGNLLCNDQVVIEQLFEKINKTFVIHSEDLSTLLEAQEQCKKLDTPLPPDIHMHCRPAEACVKATIDLIEIAKQTNAKAHFLHITTGQEVKILSKLHASNITSEVCPHYLWFSSKDYQSMGNLIKVNPSIKTEKDRQALIQAIKDKIINTIGTDHAPHLLEEKQKPYRQAPSGAPSIQHFYPAIFQIFENNNLPFDLIPTFTAHNPAKIFNIPARGYLKPGYWADISIIERKTTDAKDKIFHKCGWSVFDGQKINYQVFATITNGQIGWYNRQIHATKGQAIEFL